MIFVSLCRFRHCTYCSLVPGSLCSCSCTRRLHPDLHKDPSEIGVILMMEKNQDLDLLSKHMIVNYIGGDGSKLKGITGYLIKKGSFLAL
jgi:hypothetical protein